MPQLMTMPPSPRKVIKQPKETKMLNQVKVNKDRLVSTLKENLDTHKELYTAAVEAYKLDYVVALDAHTHAVKGGNWKSVLDLPAKPQSYAKEYEKVLSQLDFSVDETLTLTQQEFNQFVLDDWNFDRVFFSNFISASSRQYASDTVSAGAMAKLTSKLSALDEF